jgi:hypothetical protein
MEISCVGGGGVGREKNLFNAQSSQGKANFKIYSRLFFKCSVGGKFGEKEEMIEMSFRFRRRSSKYNFLIQFFSTIPLYVYKGVQVPTIYLRFDI